MRQLPILIWGSGVPRTSDNDQASDRLQHAFNRFQTPYVYLTPLDLDYGPCSEFYKQNNTQKLFSLLNGMYVRCLRRFGGKLTEIINVSRLRDLTNVKGTLIITGFDHGQILNARVRNCLHTGKHRQKT